MIKKLILPGWFHYSKSIAHLLEYKQKHPEFFYEDRIIEGLYDYYPGLIWDGGRNMSSMQLNYSMEEILERYSQFPEISFRHVFTNYLIDDNLAKDYICNNFVKKYIRPQDGVILASYGLIQHFRKNYPNIPIIYSTTLDIKEVGLVNKLTETNIYVLNWIYNNDDEYLAKLKHLENIEILCGDTCIYNCPYRKWHYDVINESLLYKDRDCKCRQSIDIQDSFLDYMLSQPQAITNERMDELANKGIQYFKISGRELPREALVCLLVYYLVKPAYLEQLIKYFYQEWQQF